MSTVADIVIDALGGTTATANLAKLPPSTVHSWRGKGIPNARFDHLRLAAAAADMDADIAGIAKLGPNGVAVPHDCLGSATAAQDHG